MRFSIICFITLFMFNLSAQDYTSEQLLKNAKEGFLLFRLPTQTKKIEALIQSGKPEEANNLKSKMEIEQKAWVNAFISEYTYGKVYFFYDYNALAIASGDLSSVFDSNFNLVEGLESDFIVGGPDHTETFDMNGIILLTPEMEDVPKGMPRFISGWGFAHLTKKSNFQMVKELNSALSKY